MNAKVMPVAGLAAILLAAGAGVADITIETVPVGNAGNTGEWSGESYGGNGPDRICGAVADEYRIGKYEVTNAQYSEFLNAVATVGDPYGLYSTEMGGGWNDMGGISRTGSGTAPDPWVYGARSSRGNWPVNYVSFWDACRFANWLHNGQGTGNTEDGAYTLTPADIANNTVIRNPGWQWAVCSEDEWYKAAYYDATSSVYYDYPTGSDTAPTAQLPPGTDMTNGSANYGYAVGYLTDVGAYKAKPSDSPYGTFDQGGNVFEWNESVLYGSDRGLRGGSFYIRVEYLHAADRYIAFDPTFEGIDIGFRVSEVPEPCSLAVLALGSIGILVRRRGIRR